MYNQNSHLIRSVITYYNEQDCRHADILMIGPIQSHSINFVCGDMDVQKTKQRELMTEKSHPNQKFVADHNANVTFCAYFLEVQ